MSPSIAHLLSRRCALTDRSVGSYTAFGGFATTDAAPVNTDCRVVPLSLKERQILERQNIYATHAVYFEPDTAVNRGDLIQMLDGVPSDEMTVQSVEVPSVTDLYRKVYATCEQRRYEVA